VLRLAASTVRGRRAELAGAFVALALGAALVTSAAEVVAAASDAAGAGPVRFPAAPLVVAPPGALRFVTGTGADREVERDPNPSPPALPAVLAGELAALPGVRRVVADRAVALRVFGGGGAVLTGRPWSLRRATPWVLRAGRAPMADDELVAAAGTPLARLGARVTLVTPAGPERLRVVGVGAPRDLAPDAAPVLLADHRAARLAPRVEALAVWPGPAAPAVRALVARAAPGSEVLTRAARASAGSSPERTAVAGAAILLGLMGTTIALVATFAVASGFALAVALRRRELGLLRAVGATPQQVRRLVAGEAVLLALGAAGVGACLSVALAPLLGAWIAGHGLAPHDMTVAPSLRALALGAASMVAVAAAGAWAAARRASRVRPAEALRDAAVDRRVMTAPRWLVGLGALAGAGAVAGAPGTGAGGGLGAALTQTALAVSALTALAPVVLPRLVALAVLPARLGGRVEPLLVRRHARAAVRRTAATAAPVVVIVALVGALGTVVDSLEASDRASLAAREDPRAAVVSADGPLSPADLAALRAIAGAHTGAVLEADVRAVGADGLTAYGALGLDPSAIPLALRAPVLQGSLARLRGDAVALGELTARALHRRAGDRLCVWLPDGERRRLAVVAVVADGFGATGLYVARELLAGHAGPAAATAVYVRGGSSAARDAVARRLGLAVRTGAGERRVLDPTDSRRMNRLALWVIAGVALLYVGISLASTSAVATIARGGELALLRLAGATPAQVLALVALEALVATAVGAALGLAAAGAVIASLHRGLAAIQGPAVVATPWALLGGLGLACAVAAAGAAVLAAHRTQGRPAQLVARGGGTG
jgi:putative ABC transport system permease protein